MGIGAVRAICFDLDNTLWAIEPVLERADRILADWMRARYPRIPQRYTPADIRASRAALMLELPQRAHDLADMSCENLARLAESVGYERHMAQQAFAVWHAARNQCEPYADVLPGLESLKRRFRLATLSNGNANLATIGIAHHFEVSLHAAGLGCAKPDPRAYGALAQALTLEPAQILFVGDEPHADVAGPRNAGMQTAWMNRGGSAWPAELRAADHVVADFRELVTLLTHET
ncbi:MAG TPA: HAD family hydrolase [Steroidobacteraceae bacterium]|nr:HAD family hydrolase [Steroidobacteraceae bacterium]